MSDNPCKETFIERVFGKLFESSVKNPWAVLVVLMFMYSSWITVKYVNQNDKWSSIVVENEVRKQMSPIESDIKSTTGEVKELIDSIKKK